MVFSPNYSYVVQENGERGLKLNFYGDKENYHIAIIPVKINDYFGIAIYEKGASIHFFDPFYNDITAETRQHLRTIVQGIVDNDSIVRVYQVKSALFNQATKINEATIICSIIVERYLMHSKRTYIDNFNLHQERDNIVARVIQTILTGEELNSEKLKFNEKGSHRSWELRRIREEQSNEERDVRLRIDKEKKRFSRGEEIDDETDERIRIERERWRLTRDEENMEANEILNFSRRIRYKQAHHRRRSLIYLQGRETDDDLSEHRLNPMDIVCNHCGALHFPEEATARNKNSFNDCCRSAIFISHFLNYFFRHGKVAFDPLPEPPQILLQLYSGQHKKSSHFFQNIRRINCAVGFASINPIPRQHIGPTRGPVCVKVHGNITFLVNKALLAEKSEQPSYSQLYLIDSRDAKNYRSELNPNIDAGLIHEISEAINKNSAIARSFHMMKDEYEHQKYIAKQEGKEIPELRLIFTDKNPSIDSSFYNKLNQTEIAVVFEPGADNNIPETLLMVHPIGNLMLSKFSNLY
jgi:hypothetical protein